MKEQLLLRFRLGLIEMLSTVNAICAIGYKKTGNKFSVLFNGSKGYLSNFQIYCEGCQHKENIVFLEALETKKGKLRSVMVNVFFSDENGVRLSVGKDAPREILKGENTDG